jgi:hypothetical protein
MIPHKCSLPLSSRDFSFIEKTVLADDSVDWSMIDKLINESSKGTNKGDKKRQSCFVDYGFCGGLGHSRLTSGLTSPSLLKGTLDSNPKSQLVLVSKIISKTFPHVWKKITDDCLDEFACKIYMAIISSSTCVWHAWSFVSLKNEMVPRLVIYIKTTRMTLFIKSQ